MINDDGELVNLDGKKLKVSTPPKRYKAGFLKELHHGCIAFRSMNTSYEEIMSDMGGEDGLSHVQVCLVERFVFLEFTLRQIELQIAKDPRKSEAKIGGWIQGLNTLIGLARTIGLHRKAKQIQSLQSYVKKGKKLK